MAKSKPIDKKTTELCAELAGIRKKHATVFARETEIETALKAIATERGEPFKVDLPKLGIVKVAGRKEKELLGEKPIAVDKAWLELSAADRKALVKRGVIEIVDNWSGVFYGRVTVELF